ncbi:hypothetical protein [Bacillus pseudomycoides]|uniref:hypothetical protein n=1 Tax=Bacillus pseudomycoides TaxID=64104 RepID=UPI000BFDC1DD|nr:hypothetical protein [Bacillus pseudomycoides]PHE52954.1 hypothetical protein COF52_27880 [Bacillus pseudomycoides]
MGKEQRLAFYDISSSCAQSVKTFDGKVYQLKGAVAVENATGNIERVAEIYYRVRSVMDEKQKIIAKRRNQNDELTTVCQRRK